MSDEENKSFIRWQGRTIEQLGFVNNLLIGLATGLFAFSVQLAFDTATLTTAAKIGMIVSIVLAFGSIVLGCLTAWNRLSSFRTTARVARDRQREGDNDVEQLRESSSKRDEKTWCLLLWQAITFALSALLLAIIAIARYIS